MSLAATSRRRRSSVVPVSDVFHDAAYADLLASVRNLASQPGPLFTTNAEGLYDLYLSMLPVSQRQIHTCNTCRQFMDRFGGLVVVTPMSGTAIPLMWQPATAPEGYVRAVTAMAEMVRKARISGVFLSKDSVLGTPQTGAWTHFAVPNPVVFRERVLTPGQAMAAKREDYGTVARALADFSPELLATALRLLQGEHLPMSERFISPVKWLLDLHERRSALKGPSRDNVLWCAIATAPDGYCHPRSSMVGTLLEDLEKGLSFEQVRANFTAKMHPLRYQRPQAAPTVNNIKRGEEIIAKLGLAPALERRFARLDECEVMWAPQPSKPRASAVGGVFAHLQPKHAAPPTAINIPAQTMTWDKFVRTVLPTAETMALHVPSAGSFIALTSAVHLDAPPIMKWDRDDRRNPVAWYVYPSGSIAAQWGLQAGEWRTLTALVPLPTMWGDRSSPFLGEGVVAVLDGCMDSKTGSGNALFPSCLLDNLHEVRATVEAYSRSAELTGRDTGNACGYDLRKENCQVTLRVMAGGASTDYRIDRWD